MTDKRIESPLISTDGDTSDGIIEQQNSKKEEISTEGMDSEFEGVSENESNENFDKYRENTKSADKEIGPESLKQEIFENNQESPQLDDIFTKEANGISDASVDMIEPFIKESILLEEKTPHVENEYQQSLSVLNNESIDISTSTLDGYKTNAEIAASYINEFYNTLD
eukprot:GHVP01030141.1.p1 GENE.GHVP01030141.1~~GHVP01030141.1.p1  ORF type:complete len:168 (+),score=39.39 GHVP01030141.1:278-781(+)